MTRGDAQAPRQVDYLNWPLETSGNVCVPWVFKCKRLCVCEDKPAPY